MTKLKFQALTLVGFGIFITACTTTGRPEQGQITSTPIRKVTLEEVWLDDSDDDFQQAVVSELVNRKAAARHPAGETKKDH